MTEKDIKLFKRFLKETKSYKLFFKYYDPEFISGEPNVIQYMRSISPLAVIDDAFDWDNTEMGFHYWDDLDANWRNFYRRVTEVSLEDALTYIGVT